MDTPFEVGKRIGEAVVDLLEHGYTKEQVADELRAIARMLVEDAAQDGS